MREPLHVRYSSGSSNLLLSCAYDKEKSLWHIMFEDRGSEHVVLKCLQTLARVQGA